MSHKRKPHPVVELAEIRANRTLAATRALLVPGANDALSPEDLSRRVAEQLSALPDDQRSLLRRKILVAVNDLEGLVESLQGQMNDLAHDLRKVSNHSSAATAYCRTAHVISDKRP